PSWWASVADAVRPGGLGHGFCAVGHAWSHTPPGPVRRCTDVRSGRSGCHRLIHPSVLVLLDSLSPTQMEPKVGFEPTTSHYESDRNLPTGPAQSRPGCSGAEPIPSRPLLWGLVSAPGLPNRLRL